MHSICNISFDLGFSRGLQSALWSLYNLISLSSKYILFDSQVKNMLKKSSFVRECHLSVRDDDHEERIGYSFMVAFVLFL